jgi:hypothetical protein
MMKHKRDFTCFVCFECFDNFEGFKSHIKNNHEEGTDYILCPECDTPLRDAKTHFVLKHPGKKYPVGYPTRPIILRDVKKKKPAKIKPYKTGFFFSKKNNKNLFFRSGLELEVYKLLEKDKTVLKYSAEPFEIDYIFEGYNHKYIPDILVEFSNLKKELWEVKPKSQTKLPKNLAKWNAADQYCKKRNWEFMVLTERGVKILKSGKKLN